MSQGHQGEVIGSLFPPPPPIIAHIVEHFDTDGIGNTCNIGANQMENTKYLTLNTNIIMTTYGKISTETTICRLLYFENEYHIQAFPLFSVH